MSTKKCTSETLALVGDNSYFGISVGFGKSRGIFEGDRGNKNIGTSGATLMKSLSITLGPH